jgi:hypothetical protein
MLRAAEVDRALAALNIEYASKRESRRLGPVVVKAVPCGTWQAYDREAVAARRGRIEQYKHKFLVTEVDFDRRFDGRPTPAHPGPPGEEGAVRPCV